MAMDARRLKWWQEETVKVSGYDRVILETLHDNGGALQSVGGSWRFVWGGEVRGVVVSGKVNDLAERGLIVPVGYGVFVRNYRKTLA
jgi:hypothetical protein